LGASSQILQHPAAPSAAQSRQGAMTGSSFVRIRDIFSQLMELQPERRRDYLAGLAGLDEATRRQLLDLIAADEKLEGATARTAVRPRPDTAAQWTGRRIGPFEIRAEIGRGGMASVYLAERVDGGVAQQVAIKIIRPDMVDAATLARFRLERQVLALLQHAHIPKMLDLGELDDHSPYVVMEHVTGQPIDRYVSEHALDLRQCLRLFLPVCDAVAYAHRSLIVHRDLKPNNVLVDTAGSPQLLDFGIAKPLQAQFGVIDVEETSAAQRFLSLSHAAPEQVSGAPVTTACDVYGLGALLYELLTGAPPLLREGITRGQLEQDILQRDPPPPSRGARAGWRIPYDLDLIVLRCLRKQPADRYASVEQLAEDIRRLLDGRPVQARRGNLLYRAQRFVARHKAAMAASLVAVAVLATGAALLWRQQLATARQQARADEMTSLIMDTLNSTDASRGAGRDLSAREVFERVAAQAKASPSLSTESRARVLLAVVRIDHGLGNLAQADALLQEIPALPSDPAFQRELKRMQVRLHSSRDRFDEAAALIAQELAAEKDPEEWNSWKLSEVELANRRGLSQEALRLLATLQPEQLSPRLRERFLAARSDARKRMVLFDAAAADATELLALEESRLGRDSPASLSTIRKLVYLQSLGGKHEEAEETTRRLMGVAEKGFTANSVQYAFALEAVSAMEERRGNFLKAIEYQKQIMAIQLPHYGESSTHAAIRNYNIAELSIKAGKAADAAPYYRQAVEIGARAWRGDHPNLLLFRAMAASYFALDGACEEGTRIARLAIADTQTFPQLKEYDVAVLAETVTAYCLCAQSPTPPNRDALAASLRSLVDAAVDEGVKKALAELTAKARLLGVESKPQG
jgi:eukaryotic-like serine/threonine-protein kinase